MTIGALSAHAAELRFESDVSVRKLDQNNSESKKSGEALVVNPGDAAIIVHGKKNLPLLVFAPSSNDSKVTLTDAQFELLLQEQLQPTLESATREIVSELRRTESLVQRKDYAQAQTIMSGLKTKYPRVSSVLFMSGTVSFLMNNKAGAIEDLQKGLEFDPQNEPAKKLLAQLKGNP